MAAKKKVKKKNSMGTAGKKVTAKKNPYNKKRGVSKKKSAKEKPARKKAREKVKTAVKKTISGNRIGAPEKDVQGNSQGVDTAPFPPLGQGSRPGGQAGDLQGLSSVGGADSESIDELLEEGNAFEADAVKGVEDAGDAEEKEVRTHEVPEDDVPDEYLNKE
jgi:hypothetical protein